MLSSRIEDKSYKDKNHYHQECGLRRTSCPGTKNNKMGQTLSLSRNLAGCKSQLTRAGWASERKDKCQTRTYETCHPLAGGVNYQVLRTFYLHTIRPIIEYSTPTLANLTETQICSLDVAQNNALWLILGAPIWTEISDLPMECNIPPLYSRIMALNIHAIAKELSQLKNAPFANRVEIESQNPNFPIPNTWISGMGKVERKCNLCGELRVRKLNCLSDLYRGREPWEEFLVTLTTLWQISITIPAKRPVSPSSFGDRKLPRWKWRENNSTTYQVVRLTWLLVMKYRLTTVGY